MSTNEQTPLINAPPQSYEAAPTSSRKSKASKHHNLAGLPAWHFRLACASLWSATFLSAFDGTVVATLLSDIGSSFQAFHLASWLGTAYLLSLCCFTPVYGRLADALGRKETQLIALSFFTVGTALCAVAPNMYSLIAARVLAGVGGGGLTSVGSILLSDLVDLRHRGLFQGYANLIFGLGAALGGPVGGWVADLFGWRVAFSAQIPLLVGSIALVWTFVPSAADLVSVVQVNSQSELTWKQKLWRIDYLGSSVLGLSVGTLLLGVALKTAGSKANGDEFEWTDPLILGLLITFVISTIAFIGIEGWYAEEPVLPLSLLSRATPASVAISNLIMAMCIFSMLFNVPLFFTTVRLETSAVAGAHLVPYSVFIGAGSLAVGAIMRATGRYYWAMVASGAIIACSCAMMLTWNADSPEWITWVAQSPAGFGYAGVLTTTLVAVMANVQKVGRGEIAVATAMTYMFRTIGQVLGVAFSSALLQFTLKRDLAAAIDDPALVDLIRRSTKVIATLPKETRDIAVGAYAHALHRVGIMNFVLALMCIATLALADNDFMPHAQPEDDEEQE